MAVKTKKETPVEETKKEKPEFDRNQEVAVINGFDGKIVYTSKNGIYSFEMNSFGDKEYIPVSELIVMKNTASSFFKNNWLLFEDKKVIDYLGVSKFYQGTLSVEEIVALFDLPTDKMVETIAHMPECQKRNIRFRAVQVVSNGSIDSNKKISAIKGAFVIGD